MGELFKVLALAAAIRRSRGRASRSRTCAIDSSDRSARWKHADCVTNALVLRIACSERHARYRPERIVAVVAPARDGEVRLTSRAFDAYVNRWRTRLPRSGVSRGDRVATVLGNSLPLLATYWACAKLGAAAVPLSPLLNASGLVSLVADATPRVILGSRRAAGMLDGGAADRAFRPATVVLGAGGCGATTSAAGWSSFDALLRAPRPRRDLPDVRVEAGDLLTVMYSSGTTGLPKGICHTHFIRAMYALLMANAYRMAPESVVLHSGAIVFNGAMVTMFPAFMNGVHLRAAARVRSRRRSSPRSSASA